MVDYKEIKELLNNAKVSINEYLKYLDENKKEIEKEYHESCYQQYKTMNILI